MEVTVAGGEERANSRYSKALILQCMLNFINTDIGRDADDFNFSIPAERMYGRAGKKLLSYSEAVNSSGCGLSGGSRLRVGSLQLLLLLYVWHGE